MTTKTRSDRRRRLSKCLKTLKGINWNFWRRARRMCHARLTSQEEEQEDWGLFTFLAMNAKRKTSHWRSNRQWRWDWNREKGNERANQYWSDIMSLSCSLLSPFCWWCCYSSSLISWRDFVIVFIVQEEDDDIIENRKLREQWEMCACLLQKETKMRG